MQKELEALRGELVSNCTANHDTETKEVCDRIAKLPHEDQIEIIYGKDGSNILTSTANFRDKACVHLCNLLQDFPTLELIKILTALDSAGTNALLYAVFMPDWGEFDHITPLCELIKKLPLDSRVNIFKACSASSMSVLNTALSSVYVYRNPMGISNELYWVVGDETVKEAITKSHAYFNAVVGPLLEIMKDFPLEVKEELYNAIPNSLWYLNRFPGEKQRIKAAIGVHRPFDPIQKTFFGLGVGAAFTGGAFWLLIVAGVITSHAFVMVAWPAAITATTVGLSTMLAINLYARCQNPIVAYGSQQDEVVPLLEGNEGLSCG